MYRRTRSLLLALCLPLAAHRAAAQSAGGYGRLSLGPFVGIAPGADVEREHVPTVGLVGDVGLLRIGTVGVHVGGTIEHRAGARMSGLSAGTRLPLYHGFSLRLGAATGNAQVQRAAWLSELDSRRWRGVDAGVEMHLGRTMGALMMRTGTIDLFENASCPSNANCALTSLGARPARFVRVSFESRYALF